MKYTFWLSLAFSLTDDFKSSCFCVAKIVELGCQRHFPRHSKLLHLIVNCRFSTAYTNNISLRSLYLFISSYYFLLLSVSLQWKCGTSKCESRGIELRSPRGTPVCAQNCICRNSCPKGLQQSIIKEVEVDVGQTTKDQTGIKEVGDNVGIKEVGDNVGQTTKDQTGCFSIYPLIHFFFFFFRGEAF